MLSRAVVHLCTFLPCTPALDRHLNCIVLCLAPVQFEEALQPHG